MLNQNIHFLFIKSILICTLLFALTQPTFAQKKAIDSLIIAEKSYTARDTNRLKILIELARNYYSINSEKGLSFAENAVLLATELGNQRLLANAYSAQGTNLLALSNYVAAFECYKKALEINEKLNNIQGIANNYNNIGLVYYSIYDYPKALEYYQKTLSIQEKNNNKQSVANSLANIGNVYNELHDYVSAINFYQKALDIHKSIGNMQSIAGVLVNIGNVYTQIGDFPKALQYKFEALTINEKIQNKSRIANNLSNIANVYVKIPDLQQALEYQQKALEINEAINDKKGIAANLSGIGKILLRLNEVKNAKKYEFKALELSKKLGLRNTESEVLKELSQIYQIYQQYDSAYICYKNYIELRDTLENSDKQIQVAKQGLKYEFAKIENQLKLQQKIISEKLSRQILIAQQQQQELILQQQIIDLNRKQEELQHLEYLKTQAELGKKNEELKVREKDVELLHARAESKENELKAQKAIQLFYIAGLLFLIIFSTFVLRNNRKQKKLNTIIEIEKQKSDNLIKNILPVEVANELKENGIAKAKKFEDVTVIFTDFIDFTVISEKLSPEELVSKLHNCFVTFDAILDKYKIEKIKTIGDAYMAACGMPNPDPDHAKKIILAALEIIDFIENYDDIFKIRIGISSGPVVAGIVGVNKFAYDIWGDTVNTAARMEQNSVEGKINVSASTYNLTKDDFKFTSRGKINAKNKGEIDMYFVEKAKF